MRLSLRVTAIVARLVVACVGGACWAVVCRSMPARSTAPDDLAAMFPLAQAPISADRTLSIVTPSGGLTLASFRFAPKLAQGSHSNAMWCGLTVQAKNLAVQAVVTIGQGDFETLSCDGLAQAGPMPAKGAAPRLGLIYQTRSPNFESTTPVVLVDDPANGWTVDNSVNDALNALTETATLPLVRKALAR